jgi:hypothetical protein
MRKVLRQIHPHAKLWILSTFTLGALLVINTPIININHQPTGKVVAYYNNEYQKYAIDKLIKMNMIEQYPCLFELWTKESNWRPLALNKSSKASGIAQLMPATWVNISIKPTTNGYAQVDAGLVYIERRYGKKGAICRAYAHHLAVGWY